MPMNGYNQSGFGGSQGTASDTALAMPQQRKRFQTNKPPAPQDQSAQPQAAPTFAQMQQNGQARPAPPQTLQQPQGGSVGGELQQRVQSALSSPSRYDLDSVRQVRSALQGDLDQDYAYQGKQLDGEMAKRGLSESTIAGQRYSDLATEQARAKANIDAQLLRDYAATNAADMSASLGAGQNYENAYQSRGLQQQGLDQSARQFDLSHALQSQLGLGGLGLQEKALDQSGQQFGQSLQEQINARLGSQGLQERALQQSGSQFDKSYQLQQAAQALNEKVQTGQMSLAEAQLELSKLSQSQSYELGKGSQDLQRESLKQSGDLGKQNLLLQYLNGVGAENQPGLAAEIAKLLGLTYQSPVEVNQVKDAEKAKQEAARGPVLKEYIERYGLATGLKKAHEDHPELFR